MFISPISLREDFFRYMAINSKACCPVRTKSNVWDFMVVLFACKNEEGPTKSKGASFSTISQYEQEVKTNSNPMSQTYYAASFLPNNASDKFS